MLKITSSKFNLQFFLSAMKKVTSLELGAKKYGGATHNTETGEMWSNCEGNEFITISDTNTVSIFVPTTVNTSMQATESKIIHMLQVVDSKMRKINNNMTISQKAIGSWYSEDAQSVILETIFIVSHEVSSLDEKQIKAYIDIAEYVKKVMSQECVSVAINKSLLLV